MQPAPTKSLYRILVIDDNTAIHDDFRKILSPASTATARLDALEVTLFDGRSAACGSVGFTVDSAYQGQDGLRLLQAALAAGEPYALAFVDMRMPPGWDGLETIAQLWRHDPELQVVICTAYSDYSWQDIAQRLGQTDRLVILKKPFDNCEALQLAHTLTHKWHLAWQARRHLEELDRLVRARTSELQAANEQLQLEARQREAQQALRLSLESQLHHAQKMESVGQLAAGIAHDFNNLLTIIQAHADILLAQAPGEPRIADAARAIGEATDRATRMVRHLLAFSRKQNLHLEPLEVNAFLARLQGMLPRLIPETIQIEYDCGQNLSRILADATNLEQVVLNLAANARDAMPNGGRLVIRTLNVTLTEADCPREADARPGQFVALSLTDTGIGIPPTLRHRLFEPFFTTKGLGKGTGLGLATAYGIVKQHRGWIEVQSQPQHGSTFTLYLPAAQPTPASHPRPAPEAVA